MLAESIVEDLDEQREREELRARILKLIERDDVQIAYQPIFDLHSNECLGIEALARFPAPFARPDLTFAAAETFRLNAELERLVVSKAWSVLALLSPTQFLALHVAPTTLIRLAHRANIRDDISLCQVVVEVTEHAAVESYAAMHRELDPLRKRGLRIAVDDAGAGYASLRHVLELQPDFIKVDRSLIHGIAGDHARRVAASAFLSLALDLGSKVVAEGVEWPADLAVARELGIHAAPGLPSRQANDQPRAGLTVDQGRDTAGPRADPPSAQRGQAAPARGRCAPDKGRSGATGHRRIQMN